MRKPYAIDTALKNLAVAIVENAKVRQVALQSNADFTDFAVDSIYMLGIKDKLAAAVRKAAEIE